MTLIDDGRCSLEALPDLLAVLLADRTHLTVLVVEFLQLEEGADGVGLVGQSLGSLAEARLGLEILLEVELAGFAVKLQQVVELLDVELVVAPQLVGPLCGHALDVAPLLLQGFELLVGLAGLLWRGNHRLDFLDDVKLTLQVSLFLGLLLAEELLATLLDDAHLSLEDFFVVVRAHLVSLRVATAIEVLLQIGLTLCNVQLVEDSLQIVDLVLARRLLAMGDFLYAVEHLGLCLVDFAFVYFRGRGILLSSGFRLLCRCRLLNWCWFLGQCFWHGLVGCCLWLLLGDRFFDLYGLLLVGSCFNVHLFLVLHFFYLRSDIAARKSVLLRVHHLTFLVTDYD